MQRRNNSLPASKAKAAALRQNNAKRFALISTTAFFAILLFVVF